jgi:hypothetical protein
MLDPDGFEGFGDGGKFWSVLVGQREVLSDYPREPTRTHSASQRQRATRSEWSTGK